MGNRSSTLVCAMATLVEATMPLAELLVEPLTVESESLRRLDSTLALLVVIKDDLLAQFVKYPLSELLASAQQFFSSICLEEDAARVALFAVVGVHEELKLDWFLTHRNISLKFLPCNIDWSSSS